MRMLRTCVTCRHCNRCSATEYLCVAERVGRVTGTVYHVKNCTACRQDICDECGPEGKLWEPKEK